MANQSPDRREVLAFIARVAAIGRVPGFSKWIFASADAAVLADSASTAPYKPEFFTPVELSTLDVICELIIPADETPGAHEAGVSEFIDFMVSRDPDLQYAFRTGLTWLDAVAKQTHGAGFAKLSGSDQEAILHGLSSRDAQTLDREPGRHFFSLARQYTVIGYYTSRIGLESLDYPGLRLYSASPECPHKDDPEHKHLVLPRQ